MNVPDSLLSEIEEIGGQYERNPALKSLRNLQRIGLKENSDGSDYKQALRCVSELIDLFRNPRGLQDLVPSNVTNFDEFEVWQDRLRSTSSRLLKLRADIDTEYHTWKEVTCED